MWVVRAVMWCGFNLQETSNPNSVQEVACDPICPGNKISFLNQGTTLKQELGGLGYPGPYSLQTGWLIRCCMPQISFTQEFLMFTVRAWRRYLRTESSRSCQISNARSSPSTMSFTSMLFSCITEGTQESQHKFFVLPPRVEFQTERIPQTWNPTV